MEFFQELTKYVSIALAIVGNIAYFGLIYYVGKLLIVTAIGISGLFGGFARAQTTEGRPEILIKPVDDYAVTIEPIE